MKAIRPGPSRIKLLFGLALSLLAASCGGSSDTSSSYNDPYPFTMNYSVYIKVADVDGNPMSDVTVWVDGEPAAQKTTAEYTTLGDGFPEDMRGFSYNFSAFGDTSIDLPGDRDEITVSVSKTGYKVLTDSFIVREYDNETTIYYSNTFIMEPETNNP